jgi:integral membrane protein
MLSLFRVIAILEGISYLVLLGIAMPLKYLMDIPEAVMFTGWIHGLLFSLYCVILLVVYIQLEWPFSKALWAFVAALLPFGPFIFEKRFIKADDDR